jgi:hypothetical protein
MAARAWVSGKLADACKQAAPAVNPKMAARILFTEEKENLSFFRFLREALAHI